MTNQPTPNIPPPADLALSEIRKCRSCETKFVYAKHSFSGKPAPITAIPRDDGNIRINRNPAGELVYSILTGGARDTYDGPRYVSHFSDCPNARAHAEAKKAGVPVETVPTYVKHPIVAAEPTVAADGQPAVSLADVEARVAARVNAAGFVMPPAPDLIPGVTDGVNQLMLDHLEYKAVMFTLSHFHARMRQRFAERLGNAELAPITKWLDDGELPAVACNLVGDAERILSTRSWQETADLAIDVANRAMILWYGALVSAGKPVDGFSPGDDEAIDEAGS